MKVKVVFENLYAGAANGEVEIWDYAAGGGAGEWDTLKTIDAARVYVGNYQSEEGGAELSPTDTHVSAAGEIKIRFSPAAGTFGVTARYGVRVYFCRVELTYDSYGTLQYGISAHTSDGQPETITADADLSSVVDLHDYYVVGTRTDKVIKDMVDTYAFQQALTYTNLTAGTKYLIRTWVNEQVSQIIGYCLEQEKYDAWIDGDLDIHSQDSASPTASGLRFDTRAAHLQLVNYRDQTLGSQLFNKVGVQWANGTEWANDAGSQATYGIIEAPVYMHKEITSREEAANLAAYYLSRQKNPEDEPVIRSDRFVKLQVGESLVINVPEYNISAVAYIIRAVSYTFNEAGFVQMDVTFGKAGSITHHYPTPLEEIQKLKQDVKQARQQLTSDTTQRSAGSSSSGIGTLDAAFDQGKEIDGANESANALLVGDGTDKLGIYEASGEIYLSRVSGQLFYFVSDDANFVIIELRDDASNYGRIWFHKTSHNMALVSTGPLYFYMNNDTDDYVEWTTAAHIPHLKTVGSCELHIEPTGNLLLAPSTGSVQLGANLDFNAKLLGIPDFPLTLKQYRSGCVVTTYESIAVVSYPAATQNCDAGWNATSEWAVALTNPTLVIRISSGAADTWTFHTYATSNAPTESINLKNLYDAADDWSTGAGVTLTEITISLTGTVSPGDQVGVRLKKTSADAQNMYIAG
ncbi:MAG: hypothetical protein ACYTEX_27775, partial [Planctomycetota bacterium]